MTGPAILFVIGAVVLSFFDGFHTYSGATVYPDPIFWRMAWYTPLIFGSALGFGGPLYARFYRRLDGPATLPSLAVTAGAFALFGALYFASGFLPVGNALKLLVLIAGAAGLWLWTDRSRAGFFVAFAPAVVGPVIEIVFVRLGIFAHLQPDFWGIPMWLPALYLAAGPGLGPLIRRLA